MSDRTLDLWVELYRYGKQEKMQRFLGEEGKRKRGSTRNNTCTSTLQKKPRKNLKGKSGRQFAMAEIPI